MHNDLDRLLAELAASKEKRDRELREAFRDRDVLAELICRDCAELIAGTGGYVSPIDRRERQEWIKHRMLHDPFFVAKVKATENLVREYVEFAMGKCGV